MSDHASRDGRQARSGDHSLSKMVFVSVGTSLLDDGLLGARASLPILRKPPATATWMASSATASADELSADEADARLTAVLDALAAGPEADKAAALREVRVRLPERIEALRAALVLGGPEAELKLLPAELASLAKLLPRYPLGGEDQVVLLASDSPQGALAGSVLRDVLANHPALGGAGVEVVWPRVWQSHDAAALESRGAANLLAAVDRRLGASPRARPLFVLTAGLKLGIAVLTQVACWSRVEDHDGLFFKLEDPGALFFPPCRFVARAGGDVLLPRLPATADLHIELPFTERLRKVVEKAKPPRRPRAKPRTTFVVTAGTGLIGQRALLAERFGAAPRLAEPEIWRAVHQHWRCTWEVLRERSPEAPSDAELAAVVAGVGYQLARAWNAGDGRALPAELASLRPFWTSEARPTPLIRGPLRIVLLATDTLAGELCASLDETFLGTAVAGVDRVETLTVTGSHPYRSEDEGSDRFTALAEIVLAAVRDADRVLFLPLGGTKAHLPMLTILATRLRAPLVLGHEGLDRAVIVPWLESSHGRVRAASNLAASWPELGAFPLLRLGD